MRFTDHAWQEACNCIFFYLNFFKKRRKKSIKIYSIDLLKNLRDKFSLILKNVDDMSLAKKNLTFLNWLIDYKRSVEKCDD